MLGKICLLICLFFIRSSQCALPNNIQNLELDDITSLWEKFPFLIDKLKEAVKRFRCPKGWKRLGGSCFYFPNITSTSTHVNYTCNYFQSNHSNLIRVRNAVEFLYAAHVLTRNNLTSLMIEIEPGLLEGRKIVEILKKDPGLWDRMKESLKNLRQKYRSLRNILVNRLSSTGLKILTRSKKIKDSPPPDPELLEHYAEYYIDHDELNNTDPEIMANISSIINDDDEYEYDDFNSSDEIDIFERIEDIHGICDDIHWNVLNETSNSTVFILTKYNVLDKTMCSLSDADSQIKYYYLCEYVLDFCFANILCGEHGRCVNTWKGFECSCHFLYGGVFCDTLSDHGRQIIIGGVIIIVVMIISKKFVYGNLWKLIRILIKDHCKLLRCKSGSKASKDGEKHVTIEEKDKHEAKRIQASYPPVRRQTIAEEFMEFFLPRTSNPLLSPVKRNLFRNIWVGGLSILFLSLLFIITTIKYYFSFGHNIFNDEEHISINDTIRLVNDCTYISDYQRGNITFAPFALVLILLFSWSVKRDRWCTQTCDGRPGIIPPIEPFRTGNRFTSATVFGIIAFEVLKIFEELLFSTGEPMEHGVLVELFKKITLVILIGLRYYPILASLQLRNLVARLFAFLYILANIVYTIIREGSCMGFIPLSGQYTVLEEAKLRRELGTWFIIYGLIKNIPHFFFLSYIGAELCVRFGYDSLYVQLKKGRSIWSAPIVESDESEFAKYYVTKLFRRHDPKPMIYIPSYTNPDNLIDHEHDAEQQNRVNQSRLRKFIDHIYHFDDDFRFTTLAMCTYTVAIVFLFYLACTFVFLYVTRTTGHVSFLKSYFETTFNINLGELSFKWEITISAIATGIIYGFQLFLGMQNYKKHKLQLYRGIFVDIPSAKFFESDYIASNSVHYSGFLVGYMAWGFVICFHLILVIAIGFKVLSLQVRSFEIALTIIVPITVVYLLKLLGMKSAGKFVFIPEDCKKLTSESRKTYAIFVYFSFFADCFLGAASCVFRLFESIILNVIFMARLDWSFLGRPMEKFDRGFAAYISYLHMEATYTNPIMLAFCYSVFDDIVKRRDKRRYVDECCIAPTEFESDNDDADDNVPKLDQHRRPPTDLSSNSSQIETGTSSILTNGNQKNAIGKLVERQPSASTSIRSTGPPVPTRNDFPSEEDGSDDNAAARSSVVGKLVPSNQLAKGKNDDRSKHRRTDQMKTSAQTGDDGQPAPDHVTIEMATLPNQLTADDNRKTKSKSSLSTDDDHPLEFSGYSHDSSTTSHEILTSKTLKETDHDHNDKSKKLPGKNPYEAVSIDEQHPSNATTTYCPPSYNAATNPANAYTLRSMSYCNAQHKTPPLVIHRSLRLSAARDRTNGNDDISHYSEITNDTIQSGASNRTYGNIASENIPLNSTVATDIVRETEDEEDNGHASTEVEEEPNQENHPLIRELANSVPVKPNSRQPKDPEEALREAEERKRIARRKLLRFRWHFLYTLHCNRQLFDLRKQSESRIAFLYLQGGTFAAQPTDILASCAIKPSDRAIHGLESDQRFIQPSPETGLPSPSPQSPPPTQYFRQVSVAASSVSNCPMSPAEQYVANRVRMLCDANNQQRNVHNASCTSYAPTTASPNPQPPQAPTTTAFRSQSRGFLVPTTNVDQPVSTDRRLSPFQPGHDSNQSSADYPMEGSSVVRSPILHTQMSFEERQQTWRQKEMQKIQKKQRYCYVYGDPGTSAPRDRRTNVTIVTPQDVSTQKIQQQAPPTPSTGPFVRPATQSPFTFPPPTTRAQIPSVKNENPSPKPDNPPPPPPKRMDRVDEDPQESSNADNSTITTSAIVHRKNS